MESSSGSQVSGTVEGEGTTGASDMSNVKVDQPGH